MRISGYLGFLRNLPTNTTIFFAQFMTIWKKQILARAMTIQKRKLGVTVHFSQIIELKF